MLPQPCLRLALLSPKWLSRLTSRSSCADRHADDWVGLLGGGLTVSVRAFSNSCTDLPSSLLAATAVRNAVLDTVSDSGKGRPPPPGREQGADLPLYCSFFQVRGQPLAHALALRAAHAARGRRHY